MLEFINVKIQADKLNANYLLENKAFIEYCEKWGVEGMSSDKIRLVVSSWDSCNNSNKIKIPKLSELGIIVSKPDNLQFIDL